MTVLFLVAYQHMAPNFLPPKDKRVREGGQHKNQRLVAIYLINFNRSWKHPTAIITCPFTQQFDYFG